MRHLTKNVSCGLALAVADFISFTASVYIAITILSATMGDFELRVPRNFLEDWILLHWVLALFYVVWNATRLRHYVYRKTFWLELKEILQTLVIFAVIEMAVIAFAKWNFSRYLWVITWLLIGLIVPIARITTKYLLNRCGLWLRDTYIIGDKNNALDAYKAIKSESNLGLRIIGFIAPEPENITQNDIDGVSIFPGNRTVMKSISKKVQFVVAMEEEQEQLRNFWLRKLMTHGYRCVSVIPALRGLPLDSTDMSFIFRHEVVVFRIRQNLAKLSSRISKRLFDIMVSLAIILALTPALLYICWQVRKDGGPAIYGHQRVGKDGKLFNCLKFRSMIINSKEVLDHVLATDPEAKSEWESTFKLKNDPRITRIGHFLRRTSLDELPQLFNVLKGDMSLVGPRPIITEELERYSGEVDYYLLSKPGMTGLWQVSGRSDIDYSTRVYLDAWYVKNWSMWNDITILIKTIGVVLNRDGAY